MKQVVWAGLSRDVLMAVAHSQWKMGTVPIVAFSEVEIEIVYFLVKSGLDLRVLHEKAVEKGSTALLRSDNKEIG